MTFHPGTQADNVTTPSTNDITVSRQVLINIVNFSLLDGCHLLMAIRQLHVKGSVGRIQQKIPVRIIVWGEAWQSGRLKGSIWAKFHIKKPELCTVTPRLWISREQYWTSPLWLKRVIREHRCNPYCRLCERHNRPWLPDRKEFRFLLWIPPGC